MKISDFLTYNYIMDHLKQFSADSNLGCCHGNAFVKERLGKISSFSQERPSSRSKGIHIGFFSSNSKSAAQN